MDLNSIKKDIQARLKELKPLVEEHAELEAAEKALASVPRKGTLPADRTVNLSTKPTITGNTITGNKPKRRPTRAKRAPKPKPEAVKK